MRQGVSVDQVVANFGTPPAQLRPFASSTCPSIRLLPTSAPVPSVTGYCDGWMCPSIRLLPTSAPVYGNKRYIMGSVCPSIRLLPTSAPTTNGLLLGFKGRVRRSGCCQLRHQYDNDRPRIRRLRVRRSGCCQLRHRNRPPALRGVRQVSVDQVVANFGTVVEQREKRYRRVSVDQVVANFGTGISLVLCLKY